MRKHRFFVKQPLAVDNLIHIDEEVSHHIDRVLRLQPDDCIYLFNNSGCEYTAVIQTIARKQVIAKIVEVSNSVPESSLQINLGQTISKGEKIELVIQKATELGVHSITPIYSERSLIKKNSERIDTKLEHWQRIAIAACAQCWRNTLPIINPPEDFATWVSSNNDPYKLILSPGENQKSLSNLKISKQVSVLIGPEGGFSDAEIELAQRNNFTAISLGPRILRTETAGIAAIAILQAQFGDIK